MDIEQEIQDIVEQKMSEMPSVVFPDVQKVDQ